MNKGKSCTLSLTACERDGRIVRFPTVSTKQTHCIAQKFILYQIHSYTLQKYVLDFIGSEWLNSTWAVAPFCVLNLDRSTSLELMLCINNCPCSSSPHAPTRPEATPKHADKPRIVFATLPPPRVFTGDRSSCDRAIWVLTSLSMCSTSSNAT